MNPPLLTLLQRCVDILLKAEEIDGVHWLAAEERKKLSEEEKEVIINKALEHHTWKCPISGEIMLDPMTAGDDVVYERKNIKKWIRKDGLMSPIMGQKVKDRSLYQKDWLRNEIFREMPKLREPTFLEELATAIKDLVNMLRHKAPSQPRILSKETAVLRVLKTFHRITINKFEDKPKDKKTQTDTKEQTDAEKQIDTKKLIYKKILEEDLSEEWWPIQDEKEMAAAVWNSCKSLREKTYQAFEEVFGNDVDFKYYADNYFPSRLLKEFSSNDYTKYWKLIINAMKDSITNLKKEDKEHEIKIKNEIEKHNKKDENSLKQWREFWNEWESNYRLFK